MAGSVGQVLAGNIILAEDVQAELDALNAGAVTVTNSVAAAGTTTSTSYTATLTASTGASKAFVAPTSGRVMVSWSAGLHNNTAAADAWCGWELRTGAVIGSGSVVTGYGADDERAIRIKAGSVTNDAQFGDSFPVEGLTAGATYHVRNLFKVSSGTGTFVRKRITVSPIL